jgi:tetratricopeptide (TPR) repeat protein
MVQVGEELARRGNHVLLVELDFESPALHAFDLLCPGKPHQGVVEYVTDYLKQQRSPPVNDYIYAGNDGRPLFDGPCGGIEVMPAGRRDAAYWKALQQLDWLSLYGDHDGFLFFEDTWLQWQGVQYVLIDAPWDNLGAGTILTRQFADAVALFVYSDEETLAGLKETYQTILGGVRRSRESRIALYAVLDNLSSDTVLDQAKLKEAGIGVVSQNLGIRELADTLISQDIDVVLSHLGDRDWRIKRFGEDPLRFVSEVEKWASDFSENEQVVTAVARTLASKEFGFYDRALYYLDQLIECRPDSEAARKLRAEIKGERLGDSTAWTDYLQFLIQRMSQAELAALREELRPSLLRPDPTHSYQMISSGDFQQAINYLESRFPDPTTLPTEALFDLAVAYWVGRGDRRPDLFQLVVGQLLVRQSEKQAQGADLTASEYQMLSLAYHGLGDPDKAKDRIQKARDAIGPGEKKVRSYWRYGPDLDADLFEHDCQLQMKLIKSGAPLPHFFEFK